MSKEMQHLPTPFHFHFHLSLTNINFLGAIVFTIGCSVLVVNAILSFLPYAGSGFHLPDKIVYVEGVLSICSNLFFLAGSGFAFVQILNAKRVELYDESKSKMAVSEEDMGLKAEKLTTPSTNSSVETLCPPSEDPVVVCIEVTSEDYLDLKAEKPTPSIISFEETPRPSLDEQTLGRNQSAVDSDSWSQAETLAPPMGIYATTPASSTENLNARYQDPNEKDVENQSSTLSTDELWRFIPSSHEMWVRSIHEIGFLATTIFFCSSLLYFSASIASIVEISRTGEISRWVRYPQLVAAIGFAAASIILLLQAQEKWYRPALHRLRWYVNFWNLVGSAGFIFCACFGLVDNGYWAKYQFGMSYLWGSWAFLAGALMQYYKSVGKHSMARRKGLDESNFDTDKDLMF